MKLLFENWREYIKEAEEEASEDAVLDLSKEFDSGFCKYNPLINEYAQYSPDQLADVLMFVIGTQQMRWYDVVPKFPILLNFVHENDGLMTDRNLLNPGEDKPRYDFSGFGQLVMGPRKHAIDFLWKNRESIYSSFSPLFDEYNNSNGLRKEEALFNIYLQTITLPGFGLPKAAFATQLIIGRLGCIDSINLNIYKGISQEFNILTPGDKGFKTPSVTASGKKVIQAGEFDSNIIKLTSGGVELAQKYVEFLRQIAKETGADDISRKLWDSWVELVAKKINIKDDLKVKMPDGSEHVVPNDYSKSTKGVEKNPSAAFRKKYIGNITGKDVSRQHHIPTMYENKKDPLLFESWSKYFYQSLNKSFKSFKVTVGKKKTI
tara:strand:+ start:153 stop:1283 length:1131 start_codon:yes stop_codon:yes gene_type:complete